MTQHLMSLGEHWFYSPRPGVATPGFQSVTHEETFTWAAQPRLSRRDAMQFTGIGEELFSIEGRLIPHMFGGLITLNNISASGRAGTILPLFRYYRLEETNRYGNTYLGDFGLRRLRRHELKVGGHGLPSLLEFSMDLVRIGDDGPETVTNTQQYYT